MNATELLEGQHREVEDLFQSLAAAGDERWRARVFGDLAHRLVAHDAIERELFYPACGAVHGAPALLGAALVEHGVVAFLLYQAARSFGDGDVRFKLNVLENAVTRHAREEEATVFPAVRMALGHARLEALGASMQDRFDEVKALDYRPRLLVDLGRVVPPLAPLTNGARFTREPPRARAKNAH